MSTGCRRHAIISHFDSSVKNVGGHKMCCDNCKDRYLFCHSCFVPETYLEHCQTSIIELLRKSLTL